MYLKCKLFLLVAALCILSGCSAGGNSIINLGYGPVASQGINPKNTKVCVAMFEDARKRPEIGAKSGGEFYITNNSVADWASRALADELVQQGFVVSYAQNTALAAASGADYIVSGRVEEVWVQEVSSITFEARIQLTAKASRPDGKVVYLETLSSSQNKKVFPMTSPAEGILKETLQDLLSALAQKLNQKL